MTKKIERERLQCYLSELARLGAKHGIKLEPDVRHGSMRIKPITEHHGGYYAQRVDDGPRVLVNYDSGHAQELPAENIVGDDMHPTARDMRAREWRENNAGVIDERNRKSAADLLPLLRSWGPLHDSPDED